MYEFFRETLFFLILINPVSMIVIIGMLHKELKGRDLGRLMIESSVVALAILLVFAFAGKFILQDVFQIDISAMMIAGGFVLAFFGFSALHRGFFFHVENHKNLMELAIVPLASPMIAGPATITASILKATEYSSFFVAGALSLAVLINFIIMSFSARISERLNRYNISGALIRITGLFIMSIGVQMILQGIKFSFLV